MQIQYVEEGIFIDFIERDDLLRKISTRIEDVCNCKGQLELAKCLGYFYSPLNDYIAAARRRLEHLSRRKEKLEAKCTQA